MRAETKYFSLDGKRFDTPEECQKYEEEYRKRQSEQWDIRMRLFYIIKDQYQQKTEKCPHCNNGQVQSAWGFGVLGIDTDMVNCPECNGLGYKILPDSYPQDLVTRPPEIPEDLRLAMKAAWDKYWQDKK